MKHISIEALTDFGTRFLVSKGVPEDKARYISQKVAEAEAFRETTHGVAQFKVMDRVLGQHIIDPKADPKIVRDNGASALIDGDKCFGIWSMKLAKELAVEKAGKYGIGYVMVRNTQWVAALGIHLISIGRAGLLGQLLVQAGLDQDCAPFGGIDPRLSTNPVALVFPTSGDPVIADFSTTTMSNGTSYAMIRRGEKTATPRFLDKNGNPSNDPAVRNDGGTLMLAGGDIDGHKFYALSLFIEALTVMAGGTANNPELQTNQSFSLTVFNPDMFGGSGHFMGEMERFVSYVKSSRPRPGFDKVRLPGERGFASLERCRVNGVPLNKEKIEILRETASNNGIEPVI